MGFLDKILNSLHLDRHTGNSRIREPYGPIAPQEAAQAEAAEDGTDTVPILPQEQASTLAHKVQELSDPVASQEATQVEVAEDGTDTVLAPQQEQEPYSSIVPQEATLVEAAEDGTATVLIPPQEQASTLAHNVQELSDPVASQEVARVEKAEDGTTLAPASLQESAQEPEEQVPYGPASPQEATRVEVAEEGTASDPATLQEPTLEHEVQESSGTVVSPLPVVEEAVVETAPESVPKEEKDSAQGHVAQDPSDPVVPPLPVVEDVVVETVTDPVLQENQDSTKERVVQAPSGQVVPQEGDHKAQVGVVTKNEEKLGNDIDLSQPAVLRRILVSLASTGNVPVELEAILPPFGVLNASKLTSIVLSPGLEDVTQVLCGIEILGRKIDEKGNDMSLSGLSCLFLIQYFGMYCDKHIVRRGIALFWALLQDHDRIIEPLAKLAGCGKPTLYRGLKELIAFGLLLDEEHPNAPGAGRPSSEDTFQDLIGGACEAAGIDVQELRARSEQCKANAVSAEMQNDYNDSRESENQITGATDSQESGTTAVTAVQVDITELRQAVAKVARPTLERLSAECERAKTGQILELRRFIDLLQEYWNWFDDMYEKHSSLLIETDPTSDKEPSDGSAESPEDQSTMLFGMFKGTYHAIIVLVADELQSIFDDITQIFEKYGDCSSYQIMKELGRMKSLKKAARNLGAYRRHYDQLEESIHELIQVTKTASAVFSEGSSGADNEQLPVLDLDGTSTSLENLINRLEADLKEVHQTRKVREALSQLYKIRTFLQDMASQGPLEDEEFRSALAIFAATVRTKAEKWLKEWEDRHGSVHSKSIKVASEILALQNQRAFMALMDSCRSAQNAGDPAKSKATENGSENPSQQEELFGATTSAKIRASVEQVRDALSLLEGCLETGEKNKRKDVKKTIIPQAIKFLKEISEKLSSMEKTADEVDNPKVWLTLSSVAVTLQQITDRWLEKTKKNGEYSTTFTDMQKVAKSILSDRYKRALAQMQSGFNNVANRAGAKDSFPGEDDFSEDWFTSDGLLPHHKRLELIRRLWAEGKDPTSITTWVEYIVMAEFRRTYCDPTGDGYCCRITQDELANAFRYLTGLSYSGRALSDILHKELGFSRHQFVKLDQIGAPNPYRDQQYKYTHARMEEVDNEKVLTVSIDTKAFVLLGRLKHDNGVLLCSPNYVYKVYDHDFALKLKEIYPNGTDLVDPSRLEERAVLHPVGAFCENDNTAYVALVLGKDTAESMADLLLKVIEKKRSSMPGLEGLMILADGGGANMANGIAWIKELLRVSSESKLTLEVHHFCPGTSRHNPIEHALWSYVSIHWKGKPFLTIEQVRRYISETTTRSKTRKNNLKVECWFEPKKYLTNQEKKDSGRGEEVWTREKLEKEAAGRITYPFEEGTAQHKWNYSIKPAA